jgi:hypothetical protein
MKGYENMDKSKRSPILKVNDKSAARTSDNIMNKMGLNKIQSRMEYAKPLSLKLNLIKPPTKRK